MRDIEFRGKRIDGGEWVKGYFLPDCFWGMNMMIVCPYKYPVSVDPDTVGQYTGVCDKNGKKIFEGDIVKLQDYEKPYEVEFSQGQFIVGINMPIAYERFSCEVIGNIHEQENN